MQAETDFDRLYVWQQERVARALSWYREVAADRQPAKFRIAATIPAGIDLEGADREALQQALERATPRFLARWRAIREGREALGSRISPSLVDLCQALAMRMLALCTFCRWECGVDRTRPGRQGACRLAAESRVACAFPHLGEELVFRGLGGSGTIFFTSCNMRCAFCQNGDISTDRGNGSPADARDIAAMAWMLRRQGCHNINLVGGEPAVHLHRIIGAIALLAAGFEPDPARCRRLKRKTLGSGKEPPAEPVGLFEGGFNAPILWNSNMYLTGPVMRMLRLLVDVWLPDFKFGPGRCAIRLARTPRYFETVAGCLDLLAAWQEDLLVRHLVMPNHIDCCTRPILEWLAEHLPEAPVNIMDQYHPDMLAEPGSPHFLERYREIARRPWTRELDAAYALAQRLGLCFAEVTFERRAWLT